MKGGGVTAVVLGRKCLIELISYGNISGQRRRRLRSPPSGFERADVKGWGHWIIVRPCGYRNLDSFPARFPTPADGQQADRPIGTLVNIDR
jgi:hypothetical protein